MRFRWPWRRDRRTEHEKQVAELKLVPARMASRPPLEDLPQEVIGHQPGYLQVVYGGLSTHENFSTHAGEYRPLYGGGS